MDFLNDKIILITWWIWTIWGSLLDQLLTNKNIKQIRVIDNRETELAYAKDKYKDNRVRFLFWDIRDKERIKRAMSGVNVVYHAAAMKHVPICEFNPMDSVYTNIIWTQNLIELALDLNIERFTYISTDKAVNPTNVMWATKLIWERLIHSMFYYKGWSDTKFSAVRFWNVLWSRGSVLDIWKKQFIQNWKITLTVPEMTRFFMEINEASELVIKASKYWKNWEIFILKMKSMKIESLAIDFLKKQWIEKEFKKYFDIIWRRPWEKMNEELILNWEEELLYENDEMFVKIVNEELKIDWFKKSNIKKFTSDDYIENKKSYF